MKRNFSLLLVLLISISLAACQRIRSPVMTPSLTPSQTLTAAPTASPIRQVLLTPEAVDLITPVLMTPSPVSGTPTLDQLTRGTMTQVAWTATFQAFTQTAVASQTQAIQTGIANEATLSAGYFITETVVIHALMTTVTPQVYQSFRSPDGNWLVQIIQHGCAQVRPDHWPDAYEIFRVADQEIETQHYYCGGQGAYGFAGKFWTPDSRFFYYTNAREGWPDGGYPWRRPISRYDTTTGKSETLYGAVFSPDEHRIAGFQGTDLVVWEVNSDTIQRFSGLPANHTPFRAIWAAWSPDGSGLAYLTQTLCQDTYPCPTTLNRVDTQTWRQSQLLDLSDPPMLTVEWVKPDTLSLWGADFHSTWLFDLTRNTLSLVTPTPTPDPHRR